jgi:hypothetical protein
MFFRSRFFLSMTSYSAKNRPESMLHRVPGLYEIGSNEPDDIILNPMWRQGCASELASCVGVGSARFMSPGKGDDPPIPCFRPASGDDLVLDEWYYTIRTMTSVVDLEQNGSVRVVLHHPHDDIRDRSVVLVVEPC